MNSTVVVVIVLVLLVAIVLGVVLSRRKRSTQLQEHFGPEYERSVAAADGDRRAAEAALAERRQRREEFDVRDLRPEERSRFRNSWNEIQRGFVDDPRQSLHAADLLVGEVMRTRGYPVEDDFDRRDSEGEVDTERQRTAVTSYRSLIDALLGDDDESHGSEHRAEHDRDRAGHAVDDRSAAERTSVDGTAADDVPAGRHALRDPDAAQAVDRPADQHIDPNGAQSPRSTEERTR